MDFKEIRRLIIDSFFVVFGCAVLSAHLFVLITDADPLPNYYIAVIFVGALVVCLSNFAFYSKRILTQRQMGWRYLLHFVVTLAVAAVIGVFMEWITCRNPLMVILYLFIVSIFYGLMAGGNEVRYHYDVKALNDALRKRFKH